MSRWQRIAVVSICCLQGCNQPQKNSEKPRRSRPVLVDWRDIGQVDSFGSRDGAVTIPGDASNVTFPCSLAVVRIDGIREQAFQSRARAKLAMTPPNELIDWMQMFDDTWEISEVFPVNYPLAFRDRPVRIEELLERARDGGASLCVVYQVVDEKSDGGASTALVRGAIFNVDTGETILAVQTDASAPAYDDDHPAPPPPPDRLETDMRHVDPVFTAQHRFRDLARSCLLDLIGNGTESSQPDHQVVNASHHDTDTP